MNMIPIELKKRPENEIKAWWEGYNFAIKVFNRAYGEWIPIKNRKGETVAWRCSSCGKSPKYAVNSDFCPRCGSDNRKRGEEG